MVVKPYQVELSLSIVKPLNMFTNCPVCLFFQRARLYILLSKMCYQLIPGHHNLNHLHTNNCLKSCHNLQMFSDITRINNQQSVLQIVGTNLGWISKVTNMQYCILSHLINLLKIVATAKEVGVLPPEA